MLLQILFNKIIKLIPNIFFSFNFEQEDASDFEAGGNKSSSAYTSQPTKVYNENETGGGGGGGGGAAIPLGPAVSSENTYLFEKS